MTYTWTRLTGELSPDTWVQQGLLRFNGVRQADAGEYRCVASNEYGEDSRILYVYVRDDRAPRPQPSRELYIDGQLTGQPGDKIWLNCQDSSNPNAAVKWHREGRPGPIYNAIVNNGELTIPRATSDDSGRYVCTSVEDTSISQIADVQVSSGGGGGGRPHPPTIKKLNDLYNVIQGSDFSLACEASGHPAPSVKWTKVHESIDTNVQVTGNILRILNAQPANRGVYSCIAESDGGVAEESAVIDVEREFSSLLFVLI